MFNIRNINYNKIVNRKHMLMAGVVASGIAPVATFAGTIVAGVHLSHYDNPALGFTILLGGPVAVTTLTFCFTKVVGLYCAADLEQTQSSNTTRQLSRPL